jgi:hypothetical protein
MPNEPKKGKIEKSGGSSHIPAKMRNNSQSISDVPIHIGYVSKLVLKMKDCFLELGVKDFNLGQLEEMAIFIYDAMSIESRNYHSVKHVFDISKSMKDPIPILSALFHDCIYFHVDERLTEKQKYLLKGAYRIDDKGVYHFFAASDDCDDKLLKMINIIFSFDPSQEITKGLNEYLSALVAVRSLENFLSMKQLANIACCIEGTIPFRAQCADSGLSAMERLYRNLEKANKHFDLKLSDNELEKAIKMAVLVANNDVQNFASKNVYDFLDGTWSLLPEINHKLRTAFCVTVMDFHLALNGMYGFFKHFISPEKVFESFRGTPTQKEIDWKLQICTQNISIATKYISAKLYTQSVVAAFALLSGGDAPISLFLGDLSVDKEMERFPPIKAFLPKTPAYDVQICDPTVYAILYHGRKSEFQFDTRESLLAAYLYRCMGDDGIAEVLNRLKMAPLEKVDAMKILKSLPLGTLEVVGGALKKLALSRSSKIQEIMDGLRPKK